MAGAEGLQVIPNRSQENKIREQALYFIFLAGAEGFDSKNESRFLGFYATKMAGAN